MAPVRDAYTGLYEARAFQDVNGRSAAMIMGFYRDLYAERAIASGPAERRRAMERTLVIDPDLLLLAMARFAEERGFVLYKTGAPQNAITVYQRRPRPPLRKPQRRRLRKDASSGGSGGGGDTDDESNLPPTSSADKGKEEASRN